MDPAELRMKNFIPAFDGVDQPGYQTQVALQYDSGDYTAAMKKALDLLGYDDLRKEQEEARSKDVTLVLASLPTLRPAESLLPQWSAHLEPAQASSKVPTFECSQQARSQSILEVIPMDRGTIQLSPKLWQIILVLLSRLSLIHI